MKGEMRKEDASVRIVGREFIIVIVVVFSSLSFTLGFFVGKNSGKKIAVATPQQPVALASPRSVTASQPQTSASYGPVKEVTDPANEERPILNGQPVSIQPGGVRVEGDKAGTAGESTRNTPKDVLKKEQNGTGGTASASSAKTDSVSVLYTVQLGALRSAAEARILKAAYAKKGYKTYITAVRNSRNEKIYKVRTGEFRDKKEAETIAHKLKKNEGLSAFVAVRKD